MSSMTATGIVAELAATVATKTWRLRLSAKGWSGCAPGTGIALLVSG